MRLTTVIILFACIFLSTCAPSEKRSTSFYYWRTIFHLDAREQKTLTDNHVSRLYVRYFDVTMKDGSPFPESPIVFLDSAFKMPIIPVIYIKNNVMMQKTLAAADLAKKVVDYVEQINRKYAI